MGLSIIATVMNENDVDCRAQQRSYTVRNDDRRCNVQRVYMTVSIFICIAVAYGEEVLNWRVELLVTQEHEAAAHPPDHSLEVRQTRRCDHAAQEAAD